MNFFPFNFPGESRRKADHESARRPAGGLARESRLRMGARWLAHTRNRVELDSSWESRAVVQLEAVKRAVLRWSESSRAGDFLPAPAGMLRFAGLSVGAGLATEPDRTTSWGSATGNGQPGSDQQPDRDESSGSDRLSADGAPTPEPPPIAAAAAPAPSSSTHISGQNPGPGETESIDSELVVAVFRIAVLLIALLMPRVFGASHASVVSGLLLAGLTAVYALVAALACLYPRRYGVRRPFLVVVDALLITLWMRLSQQWELFSLYFIVVIVAAMWFRVLGGTIAAIFCNFFFLYLWGRVAGDQRMEAPPPFLSAYALDMALLLLVGCLAGYIAEAQERERLRRLEGQLLVANYQREIDLANQLQPLLMDGGGSREWAAVRLGVAQKSARSFAGGDYFDVLTLPDGRIALCIADVSGKSVRAQARLPLLKYSLRALAPLFDEPGALLTRLNQTIAPELGNDLFIGLVLVIIDPRQRTLIWCNAGHCPPLLLQGAALRELEACGPALGPFPEIPYEARSVRYQVGDRLLLYTDGLTDALSFAGTEDGEGQVRALACALEEPAWQKPQTVAQRLLDMATAVLDETASPWIPRLSERISLEKRPMEYSESPSSLRRDDITVAVVRFGDEELASGTAAPKSTEA